MSRISSYLVVLCLIFLSRWTIRVDTGEPHGSTSEGELASSSKDDQTKPPSNNAKTFMDHSLEEQLLPQEPYPHVVEVVGVDDVLVPHTSSVDDVNVPGMGPVATSSVDIEDMTSMDSTVQADSYVADVSGMNGVSQTDISNKDKTRDEEQSSPSAPDGSQVTVNGETITTPEPSQAFTTVSDAESSVNLPALNKILDEVMQNHMHDPNRAHSSHQMPSSEAAYTIEIPVATDALKSVTSVVLEDVSKLPAAIKEKGLGSQVKDDAVVPTQFSLEEEDGKKMSGEEEFPTFDKWTMQYLAEQEKQKVKKQQEQAVNPGTLLVQKKLKRNFAAKSCGAKVVASNPEAENVNFVLNKNPDEYMLSPCKAKKWFVVELCEPLQIHKVDLGTTELFASQPKSFRISTSQRYPTKEWMPLGKFDMTSERTIQSFSTQVNEEFVKFVRIEMLEHHGNEYYCPVTTFRVLGVDMASDEDENNNEALDPNDEAAVVDADEDEVEESVNLFTSAKDVVVKLVKKVLFKEEQEDVVKEEHAAVDNTTANSDEKKGDAAPCSEKTLASVVDAPTAHLPEAGIISQPPVPEEPKVVPIVTKLADTEQLPFITIETPVVIKLDKDTDTTSWDCGLCDTPSLCLCSPWNAYVNVLAYVQLQSATCPAKPKPTMEVPRKSPPATDKSLPATDSTTDETASTKPDQEEVPREQLQTETLAPSQDASASPDLNGKEDVMQKDLTQAEKEKDLLFISSSQRQQMENAGKVVSTMGFQQKQPEDTVVASHLTSFSSSGVTVTKSETLDPSSLFSQSDVEDVTMALITPDLDIQQSQVVEQGANNLAETIFLKVSPTPTLTSEDSMEIDEDILHETPTADQQAEGKAEEFMSLPPLNLENLQNGHFEGQGPLNVSEQARSQTLDKNGTSAPGGRTGKSIDLVDVGMSSSSKKDTSIMKLNNRIMALEQNVSMTKKYLEELSRAFKQQNEDMMKLLNKTEKRLTTYMSQSDERELRQQSNIDILELKVTNLTNVLESVQTQMNNLGKELRSAQFLLTVFQAVLFLWLIISSYRGCKKPTLVYTDTQFLLDTMPTKPSFERTEKGTHQRRNSDVGISSGVEQGGTALKRQVSEANLASFGGGKQQSSIDNGRAAFIRDSSQVSKKRKKKRLKHPQLSVDSGSSLSAASNSGNLPTQSSSFSSSAGVLFGTDSSYRAEETVHVGDSLSEMPRKFMDTHSVMKTTEGLEGCQKEHARIGHPYGTACPLVTASKHGILVVRKDTNSHNVFNSAASVSPKIQDEANISWSESFPIVDRIPVVQFNGHHDIPDTAFSIRPPTDTLESVTSLTISPEFKLPLYHRNKIRRLPETAASHHPEWASSKNVKGRTSGAEEFRRRRSTGLINPESGSEYFLVDNYMSENRFKFPASPASNLALRPEASSWRGTGFYPHEVTFTPNGSAIEEKYSQHLGQMIGHHVQPTSSTLYKGPPHYKSAFSLSSSSASSQSSSLRFSPHTSSFIPLHHTTTQASFISAQNIPQPMSQLSARRLSGTSAGYKYMHDHPPQRSCVSLEPGPVISSGIKSTHSSSKPDPHQSSQTKSNDSQTDGRASPLILPDVPQTHRRQGSLPTNQLRPSRSCEKQSPPTTRKGSFEGSKPLRKSSSGILQGAKVKRAPTNLGSFSKHSLGSKVTNSDSSTSLNSKK